MSVTDEQIQNFRENGWLAIPGVFTGEEVDEMKTQMHDIVSRMSPDEHKAVFITNDEKKHLKDDYFMNSVDKIRYFLEDASLDETGQLIVDKQLALNKVGHALHVLDPVFKKVTHHPDVQECARKLGFQQPAIIQSMYLFKQPLFGATVVPHQDSTFLLTDPMRLLGYWIAVEDCSLENGCLSFIPGSHKHELTRLWQHNKSTGDMVFTGEIPQRDDSEYVHCQCTKGTLVLIDGMVIHKSRENKSHKSRHAYAFHVIETKDCKWSEGNWLQAPETLPFQKLYTDV